MDIHETQQFDPTPDRYLIDRLAREYVEARINGDHIDIEALLAQVPESDQQELLSELVVEEVSVQLGNNHLPDEDGFRKKFPQLGDRLKPLLKQALLERGVPQRIDEYETRKILGKGGFGRVLLAWDTCLLQEVAIKVSTRERFAPEEKYEQLLDEARAAVRCKHPNIVDVIKVVESEELVYVVQSYVKGDNLRQRLGDQPKWTDDEIVECLRQLAAGIGFAHQQGIIHRDLKPENILIDPNDRVFVADFGMAMNLDEQMRYRGQFAGTKSYMSPEQIRCEAHRLTATTDIWSIGVILYELLCAGRKPFVADNDADLFDAIQHSPVVAPRSLFPERPPRLEKLCLRCLEKRPADRFQSIAELQEALADWDEPVKASADITSHLAEANQEPPRLIHKGLRSFETKDADFYLTLLPGPFDMEGLPESVRFWINRIQETDSDETFSTGVLCGPSGSGKSSLIKAGILPRLGSNIRVLQIEATPDDTEVRLLKKLRREFPELGSELGLVESMRYVRERLQRLDGDRKLLLVFDQFEQWLSHHPHVSQEQFSLGIRQCDGAHLQSLFVLREDFWSSFDRFADAIEMSIREGQNYSFFQRFDLRHAKHVLELFGQTLGTVATPPTEEQDSFLEQAVRELAIEDEVIAVHLSLFVEMSRGQEWTPAKLSEVGGATGMGVKYLESKFGDKGPKRYSRHRQAIQEVLSILVDNQPKDIRGRMRSLTELQQASGYSTAECRSLMELLDQELRLVSRVEPDRGVDDSSQRSDSKASSNQGEELDPGSGLDEVSQQYDQNPETFYQLTHDALVRPIRQWRDAQLKLTYTGRVRVRLKELADAYAFDKDRRHIPSGFKWPFWRAALGGQPLEETEATLLRKSRRRFLVGTTSALALGGLSGTTAYYFTNVAHANQLIANLLSFDFVETPPVIREIKNNPSYCEPRLAQALKRADGKPAETLRIKMALAVMPEHTQEHIAWLVDQLLSPEKEMSERRAILDVLKMIEQPALEEMRRRLKRPPSGQIAKTCDQHLIHAIESVPETEEEGKRLRISGSTRGRALLAVAMLVLGDETAVISSFDDNNLVAEHAYIQFWLSPPLVAYDTARSFFMKHRKARIRRRRILFALSDYARPIVATDTAEARKELASLQNLAVEHFFDNDAACHSVSRLILSRIDTQRLAQVFRELRDRKKEFGNANGSRNWFVGEQGMVFAVIGQPQNADVPAFAIMTTEVTNQQFRNWQQQSSGSTGIGVIDLQEDKLIDTTALDLPHVFKRTTEEFDFLDQMSSADDSMTRCFEFETNGNLEPPQDFNQRFGYRVPTTPEWQAAADLDSVKQMFFQEDKVRPEIVRRYAWTATASQGRVHQVASLLPNEFGLFDTIGNLGDVCFASAQERRSYAKADAFALRGLYYLSRDSVKGIEDIVPSTTLIGSGAMRPAVTITNRE